MPKVIKGFAILAAVTGFLFMVPASANAVLVNIDEIIFPQDGSVNPAVLAGTANLTLSGSTLTIVLTNTSTGATGGLAATNLLVGIGFNLPTGVTIANNAATNAVALTAGSTAIGGTLTDSTWGAANDGSAATSINNITVLGDVNTSVATLQAQVVGGFNLAGTAIPPGNVDGPDFGLLSNNVLSTTCNAGLQCVQNSVTLTLALNGTVPGTLIDQINAGHVVLSFGSPTLPVPEPSSLLLMGVGLVSVGLVVRKKRFF